ncbi:putative metalloprotease CJM1_0395 family protein [Halomonas sp. AOP22-C1-8]|uniref:putative metalloprotease CJM1_0395 family protein n=1 Tax=Halomonas sp. AOP22-C1-8 TaxID=3457717 RepID=UPI004034599C
MDATISAFSPVGAAYSTASHRGSSTDDTEDTLKAPSTSEDETAKTDNEAAAPTRPDGTPLAPEEIKLIEQLKQTDRNVRQHEMAHQITGGAYTGGATYEYEIGPDGKKYAVAGEVPIDYGPIPGDPQATIEKMQTVIAAALAPADPSPKDVQVAAQARQYLLEARLKASQQESATRSAQSEPEQNEPEAANSEQAA